jgi:hypothetical protein
MYGKLTTDRKQFGISVMAAALLLGAALAAAQDAAPDDVLAGWLGKEFTVESSSPNSSVPLGGKLTFVLDSEANLVRVCTRNSDKQSQPWSMDFATPCGVTMTFARGTHYCTVDDIKTGDAELLASCHRLRTHDVALRPSTVKGAVELNDLVAFLLLEKDGGQSMTIVVDSPARMTGGEDDRGTIVVKR